MLRWPTREDVAAAARAWAEREAARRPELRRLGCFGSCATGGWGVGSDLDLVAVVAASDAPFCARAREWDLNGLPVPAEILVYTADEWRDVVARGDRFARVMSTEVVWLVARD